MQHMQISQPCRGREAGHRHVQQDLIYRIKRIGRTKPHCIEGKAQEAKIIKTRKGVIVAEAGQLRC